MNLSPLQIGLAVAGVLVLLALFVHGAWQSRKSAPRQPRHALADQDTVPAALAGDGAAGPGREPVFEPDAFALPPLEKKPGLDALIDVLAPVALDAPVSGDAALAALPGTRRVGSKPFGVEGLSVAGVWEVPLAGQRYSAFQAGVQLANRSGALNEIEYSEFVVKTQAFCDAINGTPEFPDMRHEVARARELDQFASDHDAQLGFTLRARQSAWSPGYVQQNAARLGFVPGAIAGRMVLPSSVSGMPALLGLGFDTQAALADDPAQTAIFEVSLSLDVAQVDRSEQPFVRMREAALALSAAMDASVTDDNGTPLPPEAMDIIGAELEKLYDTLQARDLAAGSAQARRLFS